MKKLTATLLALVMVFALAACGDKDTTTNADPTPMLTYTYEETYEGEAITWTLSIYMDKTFVYEKTAADGTVTTYKGTEWTNNGDGTLSMGPVSGASADMSPNGIFAEDGSITWVSNGDGTLSLPTEQPTGQYTYIDVLNAEMQFEWTFILNEDGTYTSSKLNPKTGTAEEFEGISWTMNDNGTVTLGAVTEPTDNMSPNKIFAEDGSITFAINEDGTFSLPSGGIGGTYTYKDEVNAEMWFEWTFVLNNDDTYTSTKVNPKSGNEETFEGTSWTDNGDGTVTLGAHAEAPTSKLSPNDIFAEDGSITFVANSDGTFSLADDSSSGGSDEGSGDNSSTNSDSGSKDVAVDDSIGGTYTYDDVVNTEMTFSWTFVLNDDGTYTSTKVNPKSGNEENFEGTSWTDKGNGVVELGPVTEPADNMSPNKIFAEDGSVTFVAYADGTFGLPG